MGRVGEDCSAKARALGAWSLTSFRCCHPAWAGVGGRAGGAQHEARPPYTRISRCVRQAQRSGGAMEVWGPWSVGKPTELASRPRDDAPAWGVCAAAARGFTAVVGTSLDHTLDSFGGTCVDVCEAVGVARRDRICHTVPVMSSMHPDSSLHVCNIRPALASCRTAAVGAHSARALQLGR